MRARRSAPASALLLITIATRAGSVPAVHASMTACRVVPSWEARTPILTRRRSRRLLADVGGLALGGGRDARLGRRLLGGGVLGREPALGQALLEGFHEVDDLRA